MAWSVVVDQGDTALHYNRPTKDAAYAFARELAKERGNAHVLDPRNRRRYECRMYGAELMTVEIPKEER